VNSRFQHVRQASGWLASCWSAHGWRRAGRHRLPLASGRLASGWRAHGWRPAGRHPAAGWRLAV